MRIDGAFTAGLAGLMRAKSSLSERAEKITEAFTPPTDEELASPKQPVDVESEVVKSKLDETAFKASARTISVSSDLFRDLVQLGQKKQDG